MLLNMIAYRISCTVWMCGFRPYSTLLQPLTIYVDVIIDGWQKAHRKKAKVTMDDTQRIETSKLIINELEIETRNKKTRIVLLAIVSSPSMITPIVLGFY